MVHSPTPPAEQVQFHFAALMTCFLLQHTALLIRIHVGESEQASGKICCTVYCARCYCEPVPTDLAVIVCAEKFQNSSQQGTYATAWQSVGADRILQPNTRFCHYEPQTKCRSTETRRLITPVKKGVQNTVRAQIVSQRKNILLEAYRKLQKIKATMCEYDATVHTQTILCFKNNLLTHQRLHFVKYSLKSGFTEQHFQRNVLIKLHLHFDIFHFFFVPLLISVTYIATHTDTHQTLPSSAADRNKTRYRTQWQYLYT